MSWLWFFIHIEFVSAIVNCITSYLLPQIHVSVIMWYGSISNICVYSLFKGIKIDTEYTWFSLRYLYRLFNYGVSYNIWNLFGGLIESLVTLIISVTVIVHDRKSQKENLSEILFFAIPVICNFDKVVVICARASW